MNARTTDGNGKEIELSESTPTDYQPPLPEDLCLTRHCEEQKVTKQSRKTGSPRHFVARDDDSRMLDPKTTEARHWVEEIDRCLPISFANPDEESYIDSLRETFELNYSNEKYEFAHLAFHLLYMSFVDCTVWKIRVTRETDFRNALIGYHRIRENSILRSTSPFTLLRNIKEPNVFRFLKLIGCDNVHVGGFAQFTNRRNKVAHPEGSLFINHPNDMGWQISKILKEVNNIQTHILPVIQEMFHRHSAWGQQKVNPKATGSPRHSVPRDDDLDVFIQQNYLSLRDMEIVRR